MIKLATLLAKAPPPLTLTWEPASVGRSWHASAGGMHYTISPTMTGRFPKVREWYTLSRTRTVPEPEYVLIGRKGPIERGGDMPRFASLEEAKGVALDDLRRGGVAVGSAPARAQHRPGGRTPADVFGATAGEYDGEVVFSVGDGVKVSPDHLRDIHRSQRDIWKKLGGVIVAADPTADKGYRRYQVAWDLTGVPADFRKLYEERIDDQGRFVHWQHGWNLVATTKRGSSYAWALGLQAITGSGNRRRGGSAATDDFRPVRCAACASDPEITPRKWQADHIRANAVRPCAACGDRRYGTDERRGRRA